MTSSHSSKKDRSLHLGSEEKKRLKEDIYRPDKEKLELFVQMLRNNILFKKAKITHK